ncbi:MAG: ligase-associated DNA damage response endonuclease PdeM [Rhodospirillales bacterium]|nr:ligase-associated DNA damage response endonuclease PdeM [Rhodospirillales bacterium]
MTAAPIHIAGERLMLTPEGALVWPATGLLAIADLHLEKGSAHARRGMLLPPWDSRATLERLAALVRRYAPRIVLALGDSFHDPGGHARLLAADAARLRAIAGAQRLIWIAGNHDPAPPEGLGGEAMAVFAAGPLVFRHAPESRPPRMGMGEIFGHLHPKAAIASRGGTVRRPCFVADARRLILPAFGAYTGGLDVGDPAIRGCVGAEARAFVLGRERLFSFPLSAFRAGA